MSIPTLTCPQCAQPLEYHATIEMLNPAVGKIDTGYCPKCRRLFERIRETATVYDTTLWPPLCRQCRQPVTFSALASVEPGEEVVLYQCQVHHTEQWRWERSTERWMRKD